MSKRLKKYIVGMGVHNIVEQMGKTNIENQAKIITLENWLTMTLIKGITNIHM